MLQHLIFGDDKRITQTNKMSYNYIPNLSEHQDSPVQIQKGKFFYPGCDENGLYLIKSKNIGWGVVSRVEMIKEETWPMPNRLNLRYVTMDDGCCYDIDTPLDDTRADELWQAEQKEHPTDPFKYYVVGAGPHGGVAVWLRGNKHSVLLHWLHAEEAKKNDMEENAYGWISDMKMPGAMTKKQIEDDMRQFCYRYVALEEYWDEFSRSWKAYPDDDLYYDDLDIDSIEDHRTDGTFDYFGGEEQLAFHTTAKPIRITVKWHAGKTEYFAHFWLYKHLITAYFNMFFDANPDAKANLLLRLDPISKTYQLALNVEGTKQEIVIPWHAYQFIVFRDNYEDCRSKNFSKDENAWNW